MSKKIPIFVLCLLFFCFQVLAQDKKALNFYDKAETAFKYKKYDVAKEFYLKTIQRAPKFADPYYKLGQYWAARKSLAKAKKYYEKTIELSPKNKSFLPAYSYLGSYYINLGDYTKARDFLLFAKENVKKGSRYAAQLNKQIAKCDFIILAKEKAYMLEPIRLPNTVNTLQKQYFPVLTADEEQLVFSAMDAGGDENIYVSKQENGVWGKPVSLSDSINTALNEGTCTISANGKIMVFTSCKGRESIGSCDLFYTKLRNNQWTRPENLGAKVNSPYWDSQPSLSNDGRVLFFSSNRPLGLGGYDLYVSFFDPVEGWSTARNLGASINTTGNEVSPFIHANGKTLFFASNSHIGLGGYDLFLSQKDSLKFQEPINLGYPINTEADQQAMFVSANGQSAYYSVDTGDSSHLYRFLVPPSLMKKIEPTIYVKGNVIDKETQKGLESDIELYSISEDSLVSAFKSEAEDGSFLVVVPSAGEYALYVSQKDHFFKRFNFNVTQDGLKNETNFRVVLQAIEKDKVEVLEYIYFDTASYDLLPESKNELNKLLQLARDNPGLKIQIVGHTDDVGSEEDNLQLSERRATSVVNYLVKNGIEKQRLLAKGFGEKKPMVINNSPANRKINRRIELSFF